MTIREQCNVLLGAAIVVLTLWVVWQLGEAAMGGLTKLLGW